MRNYRSQSAMEYLMTYGWAILIIAVVLGILYQLGVFTGSNLTPSAQAGNCQVQRTASGPSLVGQCTGLQPQFVAQFNGQSQYALIQEEPQYAITGSITETAWVYFITAPYSGNNLPIVAPGASSHTFPLLFVQSGAGTIKFGIEDATNAYETTGPTVQAGRWYFVAGTFNQTSGALILYVNGSNTYTGQAVAGEPQSQEGVGFALGYFPAQTKYSNVYEADVQIYNTTLSSSEVSAIYLEGIGGAPIRPQNLVGWWPLNGNLNDYSGYSNVGTATGGITYPGTWQSATGYTAP